MTDYKIIQTINGPEDVKKLSMEQLEELACRGNAPCAFDSCK